MASNSTPPFPAGLYPWTVDEHDSDRARDPVNVLIAGELGTGIARLDSAQFREVNFLEGLSSPQYFRHALTGAQRATKSRATGRKWWPPGQRLHARMFSPGPGSPGAGLGPYTALTAHLDRLTIDVLRCGMTLEVAASFTRSREDLSDRLREAGRDVTSIRTRTIGSVRQCDGTRVVVDGRVAIVR